MTRRAGHHHHAAEPLPLAEIVHESPGRVRLRIENKLGDAVFFASVASGLSSLGGVDDVAVRPLTGSILIQHSGPFARLRAAAREARLFDLRPAAGEPSAAPVDPKILLALTICVFAVWQLAKGRVLPPAATLLWYGASLAGWAGAGE